MAVLASVAALAVAGAPGATQAHSPSAHAAHSCSNGYTHAALPWGHKCLRSGQYCKRGENQHYHRYHYHCGSNGRLREW